VGFSPLVTTFTLTLLRNGRELQRDLTLSAAKLTAVLQG
jgi:hypothetical protein